jgi:hypothetical protein
MSSGHQGPVGDVARLSPKAPGVYFMHIPKTAGTALKEYLLRQFAPEEICPASSWREQEAVPPGTFRLVSGHFFDVGELFVATPHVLTILRDPVSRSLSEYGQLKSDPTHDPELHAYIAEERLSFSEFMRSEAGMHHLRDYQSRHLVANLGPSRSRDQRRLGDLAFMPSGDLLEAALDSLHSLAVLGVAERLSEFQALVAYTFGWKIARPLARVNVNPDRPKEAGLAEDDLQFLRELTTIDAQLYEHARQLSTSRLEQLIWGVVNAASRPTSPARETPKVQSVCADDLKHVDGWYALEGDARPGGPFRWSGPDTEAVVARGLDVPEATTVRLFILKAMPEEGIHAVRLILGDEYVKLSVAPSPGGGGWVLTGVVNRAHVSANIRCFTARTVSPSSTGMGDDGRLLGIAFRRLELVSPS